MSKKAKSKPAAKKKPGKPQTASGNAPVVAPVTTEPKPTKSKAAEPNTVEGNTVGGHGTKFPPGTTPH